ncbi:MAG: hypothetical protein ABI882_23550 [Acidobacteriota bacterium]
MLRRAAALLMVLLLAGPALAGGIACSIDGISLNETSRPACSMQMTGDDEGMACCLLGQSPTGSMMAMICCEVKCGESTNGAQFDFAPVTLLLTPPVISLRPFSLVSLGPVELSTTSIFIRSTENSLLRHDPPDLFLSNSTFLI